MMKISKVFITIALILIILVSVCNNAYATVTTLTIDDESNNTGYVEVNGQVYYVVAINFETVGGNLSGIKFKIQYDSRYLQPLEEDTTVDLGEKGKFTGAGKIIYDGWNKEKTFNQDEMLFCGYNIDLGSNELTGITESKINVINICFKVLDNKTTEKRAVFIDLKNSNTELLHSNISTNERYITNGVESSEIDKLLGISNNNAETIKIKYSDGTQTEVETTKKDETENEEKNVIKEEAKSIKDNDTSSKTDTKQKAGNTDNTLAKTILPNTGVATILGIIAIIAVIAFIFYKKMKKYKKI